MQTNWLVECGLLGVCARLVLLRLPRSWTVHGLPRQSRRAGRIC